MAHSSKARKQQEVQEDQSLIPAIKDREQQLARMLEETRRECEEQVRAAEQGAARRIADAREEAVRSAGSRREKETERLQAEVDEMARELGSKIEQLERTRDQNLERAAKFVVGTVWPEGEG